MNLKYFCEHALSILEEHKGRTKDKILFDAIEDRLDKSFETYNHELEQSLGYLKRRNELNVMRRMNKQK